MNQYAILYVRTFLFLNRKAGIEYPLYYTINPNSTKHMIALLNDQHKTL